MTIRQAIPVTALKDNNGHWYIIPTKLTDRFHFLLDKSEKEDNHIDFGMEFDHFRTGGSLNLVQLYVEETTIYKREYKNEDKRTT